MSRLSWRPPLLPCGAQAPVFPARWSVFSPNPSCRDSPAPYSSKPGPKSLSSQPRSLGSQTYGRVRICPGDQSVSKALKASSRIRRPNRASPPLPLFGFDGKVVKAPRGRLPREGDVPGRAHAERRDAGSLDLARDQSDGLMAHGSDGDAERGLGPHGLERGDHLGRALLDLAAMRVDHDVG